MAVVWPHCSKLSLAYFSAMFVATLWDLSAEAGSGDGPSER